MKSRALINNPFGTELSIFFFLSHPTKKWFLTRKRGTLEAKTMNRENISRLVFVWGYPAWYKIEINKKTNIKIDFLF